MPQEPQKQKSQTQPTWMSKSGSDLLVEGIEQLFKETDEAKTKRDDSLTSALEQQRTQEVHELEMKKGMAELGQFMQGLHSERLKNDKTTLDMEVSKAKAVQEGLAIPQDPLPRFSPVKVPSDGQAVEFMLTGQSGNVSAGIMDAITNQLRYLNATGQQSNELHSNEKKFNEYMLQEIQNMLKRADEEKHLSMTPFGAAGGFLGGLFDIISGPLDLGTEIFGGRMSSAQKVEMLGRVYAQTSPLVRAQMDDVLSRDRMEMTYQQKLAKSGMASMIPSAKNMEDADEILSYGIDMRNTIGLAEGLQDTWGSDASNGIKQAFNSYEEIHKLLADLAQASNPEQHQIVSQKLIKQDALMRESFRQYLATGGTAQSFQDILRRTVTKINENYQQPLKMEFGGKDAYKAQALKKATAFDFTSKLAEFESVMLENIDLDIEKALKNRLGEKGYEFHKKYVEPIETKKKKDKAVKDEERERQKKVYREFYQRPSTGIEFFR